ncbi:MAG: thioredoxin family protein [Candidatus Methanofastidiosia archaeon]
MNKKDKIIYLFIGVLFLVLIYNTSSSFLESAKPKGKYINEPAKGYREYSERLEWIWNDIPKALELAGEENKLVLVDFWAVWCVWCIKADKITFPDSEVEDLILKYFIIVKVDVDRYPGLQSRYGARALPTVVILDSDGNKLGSIIGFREPFEFSQLLRQFIQG